MAVPSDDEPLHPFASGGRPIGAAFEVIVETRWGDAVVLVGSSKELGEWKPHQGLKMSTDCSCYPTWHVKADLVEESEYKFVILRAEQHGNCVVEWEPLLFNRKLTFSGRNGSHSLKITAQWGCQAFQEWIPNHTSPILERQHQHAGETSPTFFSRTVSVSTPPPIISPKNSWNTMSNVCRSPSLPSSCTSPVVSIEPFAALPASCGAENPARALAASQSCSLCSPRRLDSSPCDVSVPEPETKARSPLLSRLLGLPLDRIESCDGSWPPSECGSTR